MQHATKQKQNKQKIRTKQRERERDCQNMAINKRVFFSQVQCLGICLNGMEIIMYIEYK